MPEVVSTLRRRSVVFDAPPITDTSMPPASGMDPSSIPFSALTKQQLAAADATIGALPGGRSRPASLDLGSRPLGATGRGANGGGSSKSLDIPREASGGSESISGLREASDPRLLREQSDLAAAYGTDQPQLTPWQQVRMIW